MPASGWARRGRDGAREDPGHRTRRAGRAKPGRACGRASRDRTRRSSAGPQLDLAATRTRCGGDRWRRGRTSSSPPPPTPRSTRPRTSRSWPSRSTPNGAGAVAAAAAEVGAPVIQLSTDYVFSGDGDERLCRDGRDRPAKRLRPHQARRREGGRAANPRHVILRTAWVYSPFGRNFVKTMLRLASQRDTCRVVADQWGNPTSALDIADGILRIAETIAADRAGRALRHIPPCRRGQHQLGRISRDRCSPKAAQASAGRRPRSRRSRRRTIRQERAGRKNSRLSCEKLLASMAGARRDGRNRAATSSNGCWHKSGPCPWQGIDYDLAGPTLRKTHDGLQMRDGVTLGGRPYHFFARSSRSAAASSICSASSFFSLAFSSSSAFSRFASETSMPPYLAFQL